MTKAISIRIWHADASGGWPRSRSSGRRSEPDRPFECRERPEEQKLADDQHPDHQLAGKFIKNVCLRSTHAPPVRARSLVNNSQVEGLSRVMYDDVRAPLRRGTVVAQVTPA